MSTRCADYDDRMSQDSGSRPADTRADELRHAQQQRQQRTLIAFALIEGFFLMVAMLAVYAFDLIDPSVGIWLIVALALFGGSLLSAYLVISMRRNQRELAELSQS